MTRRTIIRSRKNADALYNEARYDLARQKREQRVLRQRAANAAYWDNLSPEHRKRIAEGFANDEKKKLIARAIGYPYSFVMYCWEHHYADLCTVRP